MAGMRFTGVTGEVALTTPTTKTLWSITAPSNQRVFLTEWAVTFKGTSATDAPNRVELLRSTGGTSSTFTPSKFDSSMTETVQTVCRQTFTGEPTAGDILWQSLVSPAGGGETWGAGNTGPIVIKGGETVALRVVSPSSNVNVSSRFIAEE